MPYFVDVNLNSNEANEQAEAVEAQARAREADARLSKTLQDLFTQYKIDILETAQLVRTRVGDIVYVSEHNSELGLDANIANPAVITRVLRGEELTSSMSCIIFVCCGFRV